MFLDCICGSTTGGLGLLGLYINEHNVHLIVQTLKTLTEYCQVRQGGGGVRCRRDSSLSCWCTMQLRSCWPSTFRTVRFTAQRRSYYISIVCFYNSCRSFKAI